MTVTGSTMIAYLHPGVVSHNFMHSMLVTQMHKGNPEHEIVPVKSGPNLFKSRNSVARKFLASRHEWLWFVDSDMGFYGNTLENLHVVADPKERPVIGALYFGQWEDEPDGLGGWRPHKFPQLYDRHGSEYRTWSEWPDNELVRVDATGTGCLMIHRNVFKHQIFKKRDWFSPMQDLGEDLAFCRRLEKARIPIHVHTGIKTNHHKSVYLTG